MVLKELYRIPTWQLNAQTTVIMRADCNVPSNNGMISNDARLKSIFPTINLMLNSGARIILLTHWGRPTHNDPSLSTQHLIPWFLHHNIDTIYCNSPLSLLQDKTDTARLIICENIRFLDSTTAEKWIIALAQLGNYFVNDGFSVMHRDDLFNTELPRLFPYEKRSIGISTYHEIERLDNFIHQIQKPTLGIFGGAKLTTKIDVIKKITAQYLDTVALLPTLCLPFFKQQGLLNAAHLLLPTDLLITADPAHNPPYILISPEHIPSDQAVITIGPKTTALLIQQVRNAQSIIVNGFSGFLEIPKSLEPMKDLLTCISRSEINCLIVGGDTYALIQKFGLAHCFPHYSLAGGAALDYCAGKKLPGLTAISILFS